MCRAKLEPAPERPLAASSKVDSGGALQQVRCRACHTSGDAATRCFGRRRRAGRPPDALDRPLGPRADSRQAGLLREGPRSQGPAAAARRRPTHARAEDGAARVLVRGASGASGAAAAFARNDGRRLRRPQRLASLQAPPRRGPTRAQPKGCAAFFSSVAALACSRFGAPGGVYWRRARSPRPGSCALSPLGNGAQEATFVRRSCLWASRE